MDSVNVILLNQKAWEKYEEKSVTNEMHHHGKPSFLSPDVIFAVEGVKQDKLYNVFLVFKQIGRQGSWSYHEGRWKQYGQHNSRTITMVHSIKHPDGDRSGRYWMHGAICFDEVQITMESAQQTSKIEKAAEHLSQMVPLKRSTKYFLSIKISELESEQECTVDFTKTEFIALSQAYRNKEVKSLKDLQRLKTSSCANISRLKRKYGEIFEEPPVKKSAQINYQSSSSSSFACSSSLSSTDHSSSSPSSTGYPCLSTIDNPPSSSSIGYPSSSASSTSSSSTYYSSSLASSTINHPTSSSSTNDKISVQLTEKEIWQKYKNIGNEMLLMKSQTRKLIPGPCFEVSGLKSDAFYNINLQFRLTHTSVSYKNCPTWELIGEVNEEIIDGKVRHDDNEQTGEIWNGLKFIDFSLVTIQGYGEKTTTDLKFVKLKSRVAYVLALEIVEEVKTSKENFLPPTETVKIFEETHFITVGSYHSDEIKRLKTDHERSRRLQIVHERKRKHREMIYLGLPTTSRNEEN